MTPIEFAMLREVAVRSPSPLMIGPLVPWVCDYKLKGRRYSIVLYGTDPRQVWEDNRNLLPSMSVEGILQAEVGP